MSEDVARRECLTGLAALAAGRWADEPFKIDAPEEWGEIGDALYVTGEHAPRRFIGSTVFDGRMWELEDEQIDDHTVEVTYSDRGVALSAEGVAEGPGDLEGRVHSGWLAELSPAEAKDVAVSIYMAAEELERWRDPDSPAEK